MRSATRPVPLHAGGPQTLWCACGRALTTAEDAPASRRAYANPADAPFTFLCLLCETARTGQESGSCA